MKKYLIPVMIGAFALPVVANASDKVSEPVSFSAEDLDIDGSGDIIVIENPNARKKNTRKMPPRTSFFSGYEYTYKTFDNNPRVGTLVRILADGSTKINDNWRFRFVLSEREQFKGENMDQGAGRINMVLAPRFEKWVNPNFSYFLEGTYKHQSESDGWEGKEYIFKPGFNLSYGKNFYNIVSQFQYKETDNYRNDNHVSNYTTGIEVEQAFIHRYTTRINTGFKVLYNQQDNANNNWNKNIRPFVNYRFNNNVRTEFNISFGKNGSDNDSGHSYRNYNLNTNIPINSTFKAIVNFGYRKGKRYGDVAAAGDYTELFTKIGINTRF